MAKDKESWQSLSEELKAWRDSGTQATFWWRDDDAIEPTPALARMLDMAEVYKVPLALAVIPAQATQDLADLVNVHPDICILQHGFSHTNHALSGEKKSELSARRGLETMLWELSYGHRVLRMFDHARPVLVPPWNRLSSPVLEALSGLGFQGLSTYAARSAAWAAPGLLVVNTHVDVIDWKQTRGFIGTEAVLAGVVSHLKNKRLGMADAAEPTGLLSHHLVHDEACWTFIEDFLHHLGTHDGAKVVSLAEVLPV